MRVGRSEVRFSHHSVQILLNTSVHDNVIEVFQLIVEVHGSHLTQIVHIHVHPDNWLISTLVSMIAGFYVEKRTAKNWNCGRRRALLLRIVIVVILVAIRVGLRRLLDAIYLELGWISIFLCNFNGVWLAVTATISRLGVFKVSLAVVAEIPLLFCLHLTL